MREIKFRAWDKDEKRMSLWFNLAMYGVQFEKPEDSLPIVFVASDQARFELMQYTGLKDKNGKEIYEGDIICLDPKRHYAYKDVVILAAVFWDQVQGSYYHTYTDGRPPKRMFEGCEVVGNIYENPELLEGK